jgi:alpha-1,2-mannosyltransferase
VALDLLRSRRRSVGAGLGVAIAVKLTPAVILPWFLLMRDRTRLRRTALWAGGCTVAGLLLVWPSASHYLGRALWDSSRFGANDIPGNQSVRGMLLRAGLDGRPAAVAWLALAVLLGGLAMTGARRLERTGNRLGAVGVLVCLSVAVSPISWVHHLVWLAFPVAALVAGGHVRLAVAWWVALVLSLPSLGAAADRVLPDAHLLWLLVVDLQGLTAVAAVVLLPRLLARPAEPPDGRRELAPHRVAPARAAQGSSR